MFIIIMNDAIEFFDVPDEYEIELVFADNRRNMRCNCKCDISQNNTVTEIYDSYDQTIATSIKELADLGVVKATVIGKHEIDMSEVL